MFTDAPMTFIDATGARMDWLGHSTYAQSPDLLDDIRAIFEARRMDTRRSIVPTGAYWTYHHPQ